MTITHIVLFQFKDSASQKDIQELSDQMLGLKDNCIHPDSMKPYILSASGGTDNSPEGMAEGITHAFVMEFRSVEDRDYYVVKDPVHDEFKKRAGEVLQRAQVIDYTHGSFQGKNMSS